MSSPDENHPLLPPGAHPTPSRKLGARRYVPSEKAKGKQRADPDTVMSDDEPSSPSPLDKGKGKAPPEDDGVGRPVTIIFSNDDSHLQVWVEEGENVRHVKDKIRTLRPSVAGLQLKIIYAGRLLTDGILLLPWLRSLEERVKRHASGVSGAIRDVVDLAGTSAPAPAPEQEPAKINLHCNVGGPLETNSVGDEEDTSDAEVRPQRRGFDALLDAGLSPEDVAAMRRQFYESRGEEVPDGLDGDVSDEHARALEEQWIEGDLTPATATTTQEGMFASILHGFLIGFLYPLLPWFFFKDQPLPNFFDAEAEADQRFRREEAALRAEEERRAAIHATAMGLAPPPAVPDVPPEDDGETVSVSARVSNSPLVGGEVVSSVAFGKRTQIGIILGTLINLVFGSLNYLG